MGEALVKISKPIRALACVSAVSGVSASVRVSISQNLLAPPGGASIPQQQAAGAAATPSPTQNRPTRQTQIRQQVQGKRESASATAQKGSLAAHGSLGPTKKCANDTIVERSALFF